ncbi:hypothetical protein [Aureimonas mangrovi]|nr:hypothetical protein [Aureimonas mangrovi]
MSWRRDSGRALWHRSDGVVITDQQIMGMKPFVAALTLQVLKEAVR